MIDANACMHRSYALIKHARNLPPLSPCRRFVIHRPVTFARILRAARRALEWL